MIVLAFLVVATWLLCVYHHVHIPDEKKGQPCGCFFYQEDKNFPRSILPSGWPPSAVREIGKASIPRGAVRWLHKQIRDTLSEKGASGPLVGI